MQLVVLAVIALAALAQPADACSCGPPRAFMLPDDVAPTNTRVLLWLPPDGFSEFIQDPKPPFTLRAAGTSAPIVVEQRMLGSGDLRVAELVPRMTLRPKTKFELVDATNRVLGTFTTTDGPATTAPTWGGIDKAEYIQFKNAGGGSCTRGQPFARLTIAKPTTTATAIYAIRVAGRTGKIDHTKPPTTYILGSPTAFVLGSQSNCSVENFAFPKAKSLVIGIELVDIAGNASTSTQVTLNVAKPIVR